MKKLLSIVLSMAISFSAVMAAIAVPAAAETATFKTEHSVVDFSKYNLVKTNGTDNKTTGNVVDYCNWSIETETDGNKYMHFSKTSAQKGNWMPYWAFVANPTGATDWNGHYRIQPNARYRISFDYKLSADNGLGSTWWVNANLVSSNQYYVYNTWYNGATTVGDNEKLNRVDTGKSAINLEAADEWTHITVEFYGPKIVQSNSSLNFVLGGVASHGVEFSIDNIVLDRLGSVVLKDGDGTEQTLWGVPSGNSNKYNSAMSNCAAEEIPAGDNSEQYGSGSTATVQKKNFYSDEARTVSVAAPVFENTEGKVYYTKNAVTTENQVAFTGFDVTKNRDTQYGKKDEDNPWVSFWRNGLFRKQAGFEIVDTESYTGTKSLHYSPINKANASENLDDKQVIYIGNGYEYKPGRTYRISFYIKKDSSVEEPVDKLRITACAGGDVSFWNNKNTAYSNIDVALTDEWTGYTIDYTVGGRPASLSSIDEQYFYGPALRFGTDPKVQAGFYLDSVVISEVLDDSVALNIENEDGLNGKAMRFTASYLSNDGKNISLSGTDYIVAERGVLVKSATETTELIYENISNSRILNVVKTDNLDECRDYDESTGRLTFSVAVDGFAENDERQVVARAFVKLNDGSVFYSAPVSNSIAKPQYVPQGYSLVWGDEFDGTSLNTDKWEVKDTASAYSDQNLSSDSANNKTMFVSNGALTLKSYKETDGTYSFSNNLTTHNTMNFKNGYIELRAKIPYETGSWASFYGCSDAWMNPTTFKSSSTTDSSYNANFNIEMDFIELVDGSKGFATNLHKWNGKDYQLKSENRAKEILPSGDKAGYHTYGFLWTDAALTIYVDGVQKGSYDLTTESTLFSDNSGMSCFQDWLYFNLGGGVYTEEYAKANTWAKEFLPIPGSEFPFEFVIDYVRIYQSEKLINTK